MAAESIRFNGSLPSLVLVGREKERARYPGARNVLENPARILRLAIDFQLFALTFSTARWD